MIYSKDRVQFFLSTWILSLTLFLSSCRKFIEPDTPIDRITSAQVFADDATATAAMTGLYENIMSANLFFASGALTIYTGLAADEFSNTNSYKERVEFANNALTPGNSTLQNDIWRYAYNYIYQANAIIEGVSKSSSLTAQTKKQLQGEAKFVRAFCNFYLVNSFGDIPLVLTTDYATNDTLARTATAKVYAQVIEDLVAAKDLLGTGNISGQPIRPNRWAASALLARVYLYQKSWANAEAEATEIINSGAYQLDKDLNKIFLANSSEAIWQLQPVLSYPTTNTFEGFAFIPAGNLVPNFPLTTYLLDAFEPNDQRKANWAQSITLNGTVYYYPFKYKIRADYNTSSEYQMVIRFAEEYLIRAEAQTQLNKLGAASNDLNIIRSRAGLPNTTANNQSSLLAAIMHERQVEFFAEWGTRWYDLKRTGKIDGVLSVEKNNWQTTASLFPIPLAEMKSNPFLKQNPGY